MGHDSRSIGTLERSVVTLERVLDLRHQLHEGLVQRIPPLRALRQWLEEMVVLGVHGGGGGGGGVGWGSGEGHTRAALVLEQVCVCV